MCVFLNTKETFEFHFICLRYYQALCSTVEMKLETENLLVSFFQIVLTKKIAKDLTGNSQVPATGLNKNVSGKFKHGCFPSKSSNRCKCLPTVSTSEIIVNILVYITSDKETINVFKDAILCKSGSGLITVLQTQLYI